MEAQFRFNSELLNYFVNHFESESFYHRPVTINFGYDDFSTKCGFLYFKDRSEVSLTRNGYTLSIPKTHASLDNKPEYVFITIEEAATAHLVFIPTSPLLGNEDGFLKLINFNKTFYIPSQRVSVRLHPVYEYTKVTNDRAWNGWLDLNARVFQDRSEVLISKLPNISKLRFYGGQYAI